MLEETCDDNLGIKIQRRKNSITNRNLLIAACEGGLDEIHNCIGQGADIKFVDRDGNTPLHYAIQSKNVDVVKYLVENLEDINVENNECKTPLDIAIAIKQNDIIEMLHEKNVTKAVEILQNEKDHDDIVNVRSFMEGAFHNDYFISLSAEDIQNILDFQYFRKSGEHVVKSIEIILKENETKEVIENEIDKFIETKKTTTLILNLRGWDWSTLVFYYTNEGQFKAYYYTLFCNPPFYIIDLIHSKGIEIRYIKLDQQIFPSTIKQKKHICVSDSGIYALKFAELFDPFLDEEEVKKKLQGLNEEKEREFYANILMEKKRVEDKIEVCFETLHNLNKNISDVEKLNHKNANVFINFLEAFALQDTFPKLSKNLWIQEEKDKIKKKLTKLKKDYFTTYYFEPEPGIKGKSDYEHIDSARQRILHSRKIMQPQDFDCFMKDKSSVCNFFKDLEKYTEKIKNKIKYKLIKIDGEICCYEFLICNPSIQSLKQGELCDIRNFLLEIYKPEDEVKQDETIFNLTVNIFPIIDKYKVNVKSLSVTRNNLVHNYQEKSILNNEKKFKEIKELHSLRSDIFKCFYSKEIHGLLSEILDKDIETLQDDFQKILDDFQMEINKEESIRISGEYSNIFQEPLFPERDEIIDLVNKYLKYAFIVEKESGEKEVKCTKLTDDKKRDLLEDFMKLKKETTPAEYQNERENLKKKLNMYGLDENAFDRVVGYYLDDSNELSGDSIKKRDKIIEIISSLKQIEKENFLSNSIIVNLYEKYLELKKKGFTICENHHSELDDILDKSKLKKSQKNDILRRLSNLPGVETIDVMIGEEKFVELNTFDIIRNIFVFCSLYDKYKIKFYNIEEVFNDDTFLNYLISLNIEHKNDSKSLRDKYFILIKKLTIEFTSPYIAKLLYDSNDDAVIDKKDFINLLGTLLKKNAYIKHLAKLLNFKTEKFDVYGEFCNQILDNNFDIENIRDILQDHNHAKSILKKLNAKVENIKKNYLLEDEATKIEEFCKKILNKQFHSILQDYLEVRNILCKISANIENVNIEYSFEIKLKEVSEFLGKKLTDTNVQKQFRKRLCDNCTTEIVSNLNDKIHSRKVNYGKEKSIKAMENVTQQILKQLNIITYELHCDTCYEDVVKILDISIVASKTLKQNDDLKNILLDAEFQKARSMIKLAKIKIDKEEDKSLIHEALGILYRIEDKQDRNPKFLLISAEIAYAEHLLQKYNKSYQSYETLFKKIAISVSNNEFSKLENSKEYQKMLTISDEAKKYLSITNIQTSMALNKHFIGAELKQIGRDEEALNNHKEELRILEKLYSFRKKSLKNTLDTEKKIELARIAFEIANTKCSIGELYDKKNAAQHYQEALVKSIQSSKYLKSIYSSFHPTYKHSIFLMVSIVNHTTQEIFNGGAKNRTTLSWVSDGRQTL